MRSIEEHFRYNPRESIRQLLAAFLKDPKKVSAQLLVGSMVLLVVWELKMYWKGWKRYGWKGVGVVVGIMALLLLLQPTGLLTVIGNAWFLWMPLVLLFAVVWARRKHWQSSQEKVSVVEEQAKEPPPSGVFFGTGEPERTRWGKETGLVPLVGKSEACDGHVLVVGGAGSGKSSCIAIPTLRDYWHASALVVDIKGELYEKSRRPCGRVFNPMKSDALGYDPFYLLHGSENPLPGIRDMALTLCPQDSTVKDPFWIQAAQNVLTGHLVYGFKNEASFTETIDVLQSVPPKKLLETEIKDRDAGRYLLQFADMDNRTLASIMVELSNKVVAFATDPQIMAALSKEDIVTPELLEQGYDVFLQLPEYKLAQWKPMISLMVQQFARHFEQRPDEGATPILFLLDEFPRLGKMETVVQGLATLRSKHITIMPIIQSLAQLDATYGSDQRKIICDNCSYKAILGATDADSQKYFSSLVGTYEREKVTTSYEGGGWLAEEKGTSVTTEEKPLIRPEEFAYLEDIVVLTPSGVRRVQKQPYYQTSPVAWAAPELVHAPLQTSRAVPQRTVQVEQARIATPLRPTEETPIKEEASPLPGRGNGQTPPAQELRADTSARYEAALRELVKSAPAGTPLSTIALSFAAKLPKASQTDFLMWWQTWGEAKQEAGTLPPRSKREQPADTRAVEKDAKYEAAIAVMQQYAPAGVSQEALALQFAQKLPEEERSLFLSWWQRTHQGKEGV